MGPRRPIASAEELAAYLAGDEIECLECGRRFQSLGNHLRRAHQVAPTEYRQRWGIPALAPLAGQAVRATRAAVMRAAIADGRLNYAHLPRATEEASDAGRGIRAEWERRQQAERAASIPHDQLPPGARRADGRDADVAREYQRRRRAAKKAF